MTKSLTLIVDSVRSKTGSLTWAPVLCIVKPAVLSIFARVEKGILVLVDEPGETKHVFGQGLVPKSRNVANATDQHRRTDAGLRVTLVVKQDEFWMRTFLFADMGFAEAYMLGEIGCSDLTSFFEVKSIDQFLLSVIALPGTRARGMGN